MGSQTEKAMDLAVSYLAYKARTESEVITYLRKKEVAEAVIEVVMARLREYRYVDDEAYLKNYLENNRQLTCYGTRRLQQDLKRRGISDDLLAVLGEHFSAAAEYQCGLTVATKNLKRLSGKPALEKRKKIYDKLVRMGYSQELSMDVIRELDLEEEPVALSEAESAAEESKKAEKMIRDYQKYERQYRKKGFTGRELENRIIKSLLGRKYSYEMIKDMLRALKEE